MKSLKKKHIQNSLSKFAKENCANFHGENKCYGLNVRDHHLFREPGDCWIVYGSQCSYFKKAVLGKRNTPYPHKCFVDDPDYEKRVWDQYAAIDLSAQTEEKRRTCPDCGAPLITRQKYCSACSERRRRKASAEYSRKHRRKHRG